jgi:sugar transferase EpsL
LYRAYFKRVLDVILSTIALVFLSPVMFVTALIVLTKLGFPVIFRQVRPGWQGRPFTLMKFRTMRDGDRETQTDAARLTPTGARLRALSLDELPELLNVLCGDMSLVGPRPLLMQYLERYTPAQARRHEVRPGITGLAQVRGRNALTWEEKFEYDVWYVDHCSFWLDVQILVLTIKRVIRRDGISSPDHVTAREFTGSSQS